jgi:dipeptidyl aminopeptidase/acylaminoacyl peptidase
MNPDGSNFRPLVVNGFPDDRAKGFHQDGSQIAVQSDESGNFEVWKMNADGTGRVQLTDFGASLPDWSPDGTRIAFNSGRTGDFEIYTMDPFGNNIVQVTHLSGQDGGPKWSPDGSRLAWQRSVTPGNFEIFTARADGGVRRDRERPGRRRCGHRSPLGRARRRPDRGRPR